MFIFLIVHSVYLTKIILPKSKHLNDFFTVVFEMSFSDDRQLHLYIYSYVVIISLKRGGICLRNQSNQTRKGF